MIREQKTIDTDRHDPAIDALLNKAGAVSFVDRLMALPPPPLEPELSDEWTRLVTMRLEAVLAQNMRAHIDHEGRAVA